MHIIQTTPSLAPEFGGPARSVPMISWELAKLGNKVTILSLVLKGFSVPDDLPEHSGLGYLTIPVQFQVGMRPILVPAYQEALGSLLNDQDDVLIHDNGIWLPYSGTIHRAAKRYNLPVITTIRGMLEPWALNSGRLRKMVAWNLYQRRRLQDNSVLHATSNEEAQQLRRLGLRNPIAVLPNGTAVPDLRYLPERGPQGKKTLLFLSRLHPKKGLLNLVRAIEILKPADWKVVLIGYDESGYWDVIKKQITHSGVGEYFEYVGPVSNQEKWSWYRQADLFILPSFSENFGLVVAEALAAGTPVITTRGTPWKDLVDYNCGWWIDPTLEELVNCLRQAFKTDPSQLIQMGENGRSLIKKKYSWSVIASKLEKVYEWVVKGGPRPPEVIT